MGDCRYHGKVVLAGGFSLSEMIEISDLSVVLSLGLLLLRHNKISCRNAHNEKSIESRLEPFKSVHEFNSGIGDLVYDRIVELVVAQIISGYLTPEMGHE